MNDRFKFRVWGADECHYVDEPLIDALRGVAMRYDGFADGNLEIDNVTIEQCTGLRDKNGTLIYKGDIVKTSSEVLPVVFADDIATYECRSKIGSRCLFGYCKDKNGVEVIGNIHEHAHLLEEA